MCSNINAFFNKELTCLPSVIGKYNNAVGNLLSWSFFVWLLLHLFFEKFVNAILKQMRYPEYLRCRIKSTLWSFGFSAGSFLYCYATLTRFNIEIFNFHKKFTENSIQFGFGQYIVGFVVLTTYYAHHFIWETVYNGYTFYGLELFVFTLAAMSSYFNSCVEVFFLLIYADGLNQCLLNLSRTFSFQLYNKRLMTAISTIYFIFHVFFSLSLILVIIPLYIYVPLNKRIPAKISVEFISLCIILWFWLILNICNSSVCKLVKHYIWHTDRFSRTCKRKYLECSIFPPRSDTAFSLARVKDEIESRLDTVQIQRKKPKTALIQTLKCMVTVRRKLKQRRENKPELLSNTADEKSTLLTSENDDSQFIAKEIVDDIVKSALEESENCN